MQDIDSTLTNMQKLIQEIYSEVDRLKSIHSELDKKEQDVLHKIELSTFNASEGYKLSRLLKTIREDRREVKDNLDKLKLLTSITDKSFKNKLNHSISLIDKHKREIETRRYKPRVYADLFNNPKEFYKNIDYKKDDKA